MQPENAEHCWLSAADFMCSATKSSWEPTTGFPYILMVREKCAYVCRALSQVRSLLLLSLAFRHNVVSKTACCLSPFRKLRQHAMDVWQGLPFTTDWSCKFSPKVLADLRASFLIHRWCNCMWCKDQCRSLRPF